MARGSAGSLAQALRSATNCGQRASLKNPRTCAFYASIAVKSNAGRNFGGLRGKAHISQARWARLGMPVLTFSRGGCSLSGMTGLRKAVAFLTVLTVTVNSAGANLRPCCECCNPAIEPTEHDACCDGEGGPSDCQQPAVSGAPCCCIKFLLAAPSSSQAHRFVRSANLPSALFDAASSAHLPHARTALRHQPGMLVPVSPTLSVLYCVWLK